MADPICRWRNPYVSTVIELIDLLPKEELLRVQARELVEQRSPYDFYRTPYQLACQLGLYHETNGRYFPKFTFNPTKEEVENYLRNWMIHYCIPNPYTNGFRNRDPFSIHAEICRKLYEVKAPINWETVKLDIFKQEIGNADILINSINKYSPIISIRRGVINLKDNKNYEDLIHYINVDICTDRNNKEYFFDLFSIESANAEQNLIQDLTTNISQQELDLIQHLQKLPNLTQTVKNQIIKARIGQGYFRRSLLLDCGFCPITLVDDSNLLIASHIKPWRDSNNQERLNYKNGILLTPTFDRLFDYGFISFRDDKSLMISTKILGSNIQKLQIRQDMIISNLPIEGREGFLEYHRSKIFKA